MLFNLEDVFQDKKKKKKKNEDERRWILKLNIEWKFDFGLHILFV